jgi:hypothetical protein
MTKGDDGQLNSPACSMHEADDVYMGYARKTERLDALNRLLEVERAGGVDHPTGLGRNKTGPEARS